MAIPSSVRFLLVLALAAAAPLSAQVGDMESVVSSMAEEERGVSILVDLAKQDDESGEAARAALSGYLDETDDRASYLRAMLAFTFAVEANPDLPAGPLVEAYEKALASSDFRGKAVVYSVGCARGDVRRAVAPMFLERVLASTDSDERLHFMTGLEMTEDEGREAIEGILMESRSAERTAVQAVLDAWGDVSPDLCLKRLG